jgi:zinc protease
LEKKRREILTRIQTRDEQIRSQSVRLFYRTLFRNHPYRLDPVGETEQVLRLSRDELIGHYRRLLSPDRVILTIVGDVDGRSLLQRIRMKLSAVDSSRSDFSLPPPENEIAEMRVGRQQTKTKQAHIMLGFPAPRQGDPAYFAMNVLQAVLSHAGGRLFVELRDAQGLAYSVGAFLLSDPIQGAFGLYAATDGSAVEKVREEMLREIRRVMEETVQPRELQRAKKTLLGSYLIARQTNESRARDLAVKELFGLGLDYDQRFREGIEAVTAEDVRNFARRYLSLDRYAVAIAGP